MIRLSLMTTLLLAFQRILQFFAEESMYYDYDTTNQTFVSHRKAIPNDAISTYQEKFQSFSKNKEDLLVYKIFNDKQNGFFVGRISLKYSDLL
jgi:hypothetical protein